MDPKRRRFNRTTAQVETPLFEFNFQGVLRAGFQNPSGMASLPLQTGGTDKTHLEHSIPKQVVFLVQHIDNHNDEQDRS